MQCHNIWNVIEDEISQKTNYNKWKSSLKGENREPIQPSSFTAQTQICSFCYCTNAKWSTSVFINGQLKKLNVLTERRKKKCKIPINMVIYCPRSIFQENIYIFPNWKSLFSTKKKIFLNYLFKNYYCVSEYSTWSTHIPAFSSSSTHLPTFYHNLYVFWSNSFYKKDILSFVRLDIFLEQIHE